MKYKCKGCEDAWGSPLFDSWEALHKHFDAYAMSKEDRIENTTVVPDTEGPESGDPTAEEVLVALYAAVNTKKLEVIADTPETYALWYGASNMLADYMDAHPELTKDS